MKISCLGGGGLYFVRPLADFALTAEMRGSTIVLYDIDHERAEKIAAEGICQHANAPNMAHVIFAFMFCLVVLVLAFCLTCASATRVSALVAGVC